ncbi:hypothetical protein ABFS83_11G112400 [Erythranthe nasuta]
MSDGVGKDSLKGLTEGENQQSNRKKKKLGTDEFAQAVARIAVAQVCEGLGFQSFNQSALDVLADVGVRYIRDIGKTACSYANLANRSQCNVFDVIQGLEDFGSVQGFPGASDLNHCLLGSGVVRDVIRYVAQAEEIPFAYSIPAFPVVKERIFSPSYAQAEENPPDEHIPSWLPKFPDPNTYADLDLENDKDSETEVANKTLLVEEPGAMVERSSSSIHRRLICNGSEAGVVVDKVDAAKVKLAAESNPFLAQPLQFGEKDVLLPVVPAKLLEETRGYHRSCKVLDNHLSKSMPSTNEAASKNAPCETEDRRNILFNGRQNVHFKFGNSKKPVDMGMCSQTEGSEKNSLWFGDDCDGKDEKKRTAEKVLRENMEIH